MWSTSSFLPWKVTCGRVTWSSGQSLKGRKCEGRDSCKNPGHGQKRTHFTPNEPLDPTIIKYINESLGGLQKQFIQLEATA
ncbi:hypothetical protein SPRG_17118 [Saprolegnia parasitica CBS 223.65]|uniref:Uncharacterized protein n=1 Tax=Saprolegnia parasitica (strain CBS 223.65) TaxID=695850 RepID=A0A067BRZ6_SAPPC|nr:hypothetical protein SPRG_17118 [Saprolegnia parasitica CBS 223.65]KDO17447.1 hypothetical protein SPRG_17118 [Saprolegnia parasitica CBS 223.65]|eukprot:XP_012211846.1 hypothetical protein SPRG_17118 [Saprolegnia parasitica CBS 223.65]